MGCGWKKLRAPLPAGQVPRLVFVSHTVVSNHYGHTQWLSRRQELTDTIAVDYFFPDNPVLLR